MKAENKYRTLLPLFLLFNAAIPFSFALETKEIERGFSATHDESYSQFQPLLSDPTGVFSFGFLRINSSLLDLAVLHFPSSFPLWRALPAQPVPWTGSISLSFNGNLVLSDSKTGTVFWSAASAAAGDRLVLLNSSNLQIQKQGSKAISVLWQSFDFPSDTIVLNQNFTSSAKLFSSNQRFSMSLGATFFALHMEFGNGTVAPMYLQHQALQEKAQIVPGGGPIYARIEQEGFLAMYQKEGPPADVFSFDTFNRGVSAFRRMTLENDGNLKAYYWNNSTWVLDLTTISQPCYLPTACGAYGLCSAGEQPQCTCLANGTDGCLPPAEYGALCGSRGVDDGDGFWVLRRQGVDLANRELLAFKNLSSLQECEGSCEQNCSCWGALYSNTTRYCYTLDYPVETLVEGADTKYGYFKVRLVRGREDNERDRLKIALLGVGCVISVAAAGFGAYRVWERRKRRRNGGMDGLTADGLAPGPYKDLASASFKSIELSHSFRKQ